MLQPHKNTGSTLSSGYRYSFNGMEKDDEVYGAGNSYDFGARIYNPRLGRWNSVDNKAGLYYSWTPYCFAGNNPIVFKDPDGNDIIIQGSYSYRKRVLAELQKLTNDEIKFDIRTGVVEFVSPSEVAVPSTSAGTNLVRDLISSENSVTIMSTPQLAKYITDNGGDVSYLEMPYETFAVTQEGRLVSPGQLTVGAHKTNGANTVVHFSDYTDIYPSVAVEGENGLTYEQTQGFLVLGHELFHALYTMEARLKAEDFRTDWGKLDYDNAITHPYYGPFCDNHEWEIRRMENLIRSEHNIKQRYIRDTDYDLLDELDYDAVDHHDPYIDWEEEGSGITSEMKEYWEKYHEKQGNDPATIFDDFEKSRTDQEQNYQEHNKKAEKQIKKVEKKQQAKKFKKWGGTVAKF